MFLYINIFILLFFISLFGVLFTRKSMLVIIMCLEVMLLCISFDFIFFSVYLNDIFGYICSLLCLCLGACETALGLSIFIRYFRVLKIV